MIFFKKSETDLSKILQISPLEITPNPNQPRKIFKQEELESLAQSIGELGILQPLTVRQTSQAWELIAGERRLRAAIMLELETVPCVVVEVDEENSSLLALVENIQRADLDYIEEALAISTLIATYDLSQEEVARRIGKSQSAVANKLRLLRLSPEVIEKLREGGCTERHGRALLRLPSQIEQLEMLESIISQGWNVAQTEEEIELKLNPVEKESKGKRIFVMKDIRLLLNTITKSVNLVRSAGIDAKVLREDLNDEILLTIRIPNGVPRGTG